MKIKLQEVPKSNPNYTDFNDLNVSDTESNQILTGNEGYKAEVLHDLYGG